MNEEAEKKAFLKENTKTIILSIFLLIIFIAIAADVSSNDTGLMLKTDAWLNTEMMSFQIQSLNGIIILITDILSPTTLIILSIAGAIFLFYRGWKSKAIFIALSVGGGALLSYLTKIIFHRARPENGLIEASSYSFPSGHAMMSVIFFSLVIYCFGKHIRNEAHRRLFIIANIVLASFSGLSRLYLNVHWLSDVVAGFLLGLSWIFFAIYFKKKSEKINMNLKFSEGTPQSSEKNYS